MAGHYTITQKTERVKTVRPQKESIKEFLNPLHDTPIESRVENAEEEPAGADSWDAMAKKFEELETRLAEQFENQEEENRAPPIVRAPEKPTKEEWARHQTIHIPYAAWCPHCVAARNARRNHPAHGRKSRFVPDIENGDGPTKVSMDYMYLHERIGKYRDVQHNPPYLVVVDHKFGGCWDHQVPNKGVNDTAHWVPKRVLQDLENSGLGKTRILLKIDQEPSIVCLQKVIQDLNPEIVPINGPVGESACNGRVENAVNRVQEKMRALRHQLERGIGTSILEQSSIMAWMAKWAAEFISKYSPGDDGKTPYERIRQERCKVPLLPFGEFVMYLPMKTATSSKGTPSKKPGVWLGIIEGPEDSIIGTYNGVVKCRTVNRMADGEQWNREMVLGMRGSPWEPVPGKQGMHIFVDVDDNGEDPEKDCGREVRPTEALDDEDPVETRYNADKFHISRKAITKYGVTIGCPGCNELVKRGDKPGKITYTHSDECRHRIIEHMKEDLEYRRLLEKHGFNIGIVQAEGLTQAQMQAKKHHLLQAIIEVERMERKQQRGAKECQLNQMMRKLMFERMEVAEVHSPHGLRRWHDEWV